MNALPPVEPGCAAPPALPSAPQHRLPPHSGDTHLHVFGPPARYPLDARRGDASHACSLAGYRQVMAALGIKRAAPVQPSVYGTDNRALLDALREAGSDFRVIAVPPVEVSNAQLAEMHALGARESASTWSTRQC